VIDGGDGFLFNLESFWSGQQGDLPVEFPYFDGATVNELPGGLDRLLVVRGDDDLEGFEMPVGAYDVAR
jgi:hypothetical protein